VSFLSSQPVIDIEDIVVVLVVVPFVVRRLARLREYPPWVVCRLILELGIAYAVGIGDVSGELTQRLQHKKQWSLEYRPEKRTILPIKMCLTRPCAGMEDESGLEAADRVDRALVLDQHVALREGPPSWAVPGTEGSTGQQGRGYAGRQGTRWGYSG
jgi:hypothetical protein